MPSTTLPAAATGLPTPTRRTALAALAGLSAAVSLPVVAKAALVPTADAALIALAQRVAHLARAEHAAMVRSGAISDEYDRLEPEQPRDPAVERKAAWAEHRDYYTNHALTQADMDFLDASAKRAAAACRIIMGRHAEAVEAWEAECQALSLRLGVDAADSHQEHLSRQLVEAVEQLTAMTPTTRQGLLSKVAAAVAICDVHDQSLQPEWLTALSEATMRDTLAIGGVA